MATAFIERLRTQLQQGGGFADAVRRVVGHDADILEIGPGANPAFRRRDYPGLKVSDYCATDELRVNFGQLAGVGVLPPDTFDDIDYVCADGKLADVVPPDQKFDLIFSSHNIEHQPDLLTHLVHVERLLKPGGTVVFLIPHRQFTFDVFRKTTTTSDVLLAHFGPPGVMEAKIRFDAATHSAQVARPGAEAYKTDAAIAIGDLNEALARLQADLRGEPSPFTDYHHSVFTSASFPLLLVELQQMNLCHLFPFLVSEPIGNTFIAALQSVPMPAEPERRKNFEGVLGALRLQYYKDMAFAPLGPTGR